MAGGHSADDAVVFFLVFCRGVTPYSGRRDMRPGTVSVSDKTDNCVSPPVQDRLCWGMSLRHSILRDYVSGCGKIMILRIPYGRLNQKQTSKFLLTLFRVIIMGRIRLI